MREQKITVPTVGATSGFTAIQTYTYDDLNRLGSATETISSTQTWKQTFEYDRYGNRRFNTMGSNTTTMGSCSAAVCNPTISTSTNRISQSGYSFDANGNLTVDGSGNQFSYDAENHQKEVKDSGNNLLGTYLYDGEGRRVKKVAGSETTIFVYDGGGQMVAEYSTVTATTPQVSYLTQDHLNSPRVITNEIGAVTSRKDFSAFGEESTASQRSSNLGYQAPNIRKDYTGYEKDIESGLDFAQARYYNPVHGRYTSIDPLTASASIKNPQTFNRYSYVLNSPYKFVDPLGLLSATTGACGNWCPGGGGGGGGMGIGLTTGMDYGSQVESIALPYSGSDFGIFDPKEIWRMDKISRSVEELTDKKTEIDGNQVFVEIEWTATKGDLFIKDTNTKVVAFANPTDVEYSIVDKNGKKFEGEAASKQAKDIKKQVQKAAKASFNFLSNCHGTTFAGGKYWINDDQINTTTLKALGYSNVTGQPTQQDDVGLYDSGGGNYVHSVRFNANLTTVRGKGGIEPYRASMSTTEAWNRPATLELWRKSPKSKN